MKESATILFLHESNEFVNTDTGEVTKKDPAGTGLTWFKGMRKGFAKLALMKLSANECAVFFELASRVKYGNTYLVNQQVMADKLSMNRSSIHRALTTLEQRHIIQKQKKTGTLVQYQLNPVYLWFGPSRQELLK